MNSSRKTRLVAQGLALLAAFMDEPAGTADRSPERKAWDEWANAHPTLAEFVRYEQHALFDRVNDPSLWERRRA